MTDIFSEFLKNQQFSMVQVSSFLDTRDGSYKPKKQIQYHVKGCLSAFIQWFEKPKIGKNKGERGAFGFWEPYDEKGDKVIANVKSMSASVLDIDGGKYSFNEIQQKFDALNCFYILFTTSSNRTKNKDEKGARVRAIIPFEHEISPLKYEEACYSILLESGVLNNTLSTSQEIKADMKAVGVDTSVFSVQSVSYYTVTENPEYYHFSVNYTQSLYKFNIY